MKKQERQRLITQVLTDYEIKKQEDFVTVLNGMGIKITQATISRDIKEMKLVKIPAKNGGYLYSMPNDNPEKINEKLTDLLKEAVLSTDTMEKFIHLKTLPGNASAMANLLEQRFSRELFAILNDDDSVLMIARTLEFVDLIKQEITKKSHKE